jgi:geranylgeranyl pyrophosphate synthase
VPRPGSFDAFLEESRNRVDAALEACLPVPPACPPVLCDALRHTVLAGGKRLRPILALAAADALSERSQSKGGDRQDEPHTDPIELALPVACAVELIHTYSLIHDDLPAMDDDRLRRGRPTLHVLYDDGLAILAGDALQAAAFELLAREPADPSGILAGRKLRAIARLAEAAGAAGMVGGQAIDLQAAGQVPGHPLTLDAPGLQAMHLRKTGALIRASAVSGAIMAAEGDGSEEAIGAIDRWGEQVGLAFQIVDDILDVEGNDRELGKTAGKDAAGSKPTYPALFGVARARALADECSVEARLILERAGLMQGWLGDITDWIVHRRH